MRKNVYSKYLFTCWELQKYKVLYTVHGERARCDKQIGTRTLFVYDCDSTSIKGGKQKCDSNQCEKQKDVTAFGEK